jgi:hypothetical protein
MDTQKGPAGMVFGGGDIVRIYIIGLFVPEGH